MILQDTSLSDYRSLRVVVPVSDYRRKASIAGAIVPDRYASRFVQAGIFKLEQIDGWTLGELFDKFPTTAKNVERNLRHMQNVGIGLVP